MKYLVEIKNRLSLLFVTYCSIILVIYYYKELLLFLLIKPNYTNNQNSIQFYFIFTDITEIFSLYIKLIFFISFQIIVIVIFYHIFIFFSPAFFESEYNFFKRLIKTVLFIWFITTLLAHFILIPLTWNFFSSFQELILNKAFNIYFEAKLSEYFYFYVSLYYLCHLYFQIFFLLFFFLSYTQINIRVIKKFRKLWYFGFVIFSTLISPPDIFSQILISILFIIFYELVLFFIVIKTCKLSLTR